MTTRTHTTSVAETRQFGSVENSDGVNFSDGIMMVDGVPQTPKMSEEWESSNGVTKYTTVMWEDTRTGLLRCSCNCPGWAIKKNGKPRECKHTKDMMGGKNL